MAFIGRPDVTGQSAQWDGTKWVTTIISGTGGSSSGGGSFVSSSSETFYVPIVNQFVSSSSLPVTASWLGDVLTANGVHYIFSPGTKRILTASTSNPNNWGILSASWPTGALNSIINNSSFLISNTFYLMSSGVALSMPVSNPTAITSTLIALPLGNPKQGAIIGDKIYIFGGTGPSPGFVASSQIWSASLTSPLSWSNTGQSITAPRRHASLIVNDGEIYLIGGEDAAAAVTNTMQRSSIKNPLSWSQLSTTFPVIISYSDIALVNQNIYHMGGYNGGFLNVVYKAPMTNLTAWTLENWTLPAARYRAAGIVVGLDGHLYYIGGQDPTIFGNVWRTPIEMTCSNISPYAFSTTSAKFGRSVDGQLAVASRQQVNGMVPWIWDQTANEVSASAAGSAALNASITGTWRDPGNTFITTGSVSIDSQNRTPSQVGPDVYFFVSGNVGLSGTTSGRVAVFGGDVRISGTLAIGTGSVYIDSNEIRWDANTKIFRSGSDLRFSDSSNPSGWTLTQLATSGSATGGGGAGEVSASYVVLSATSSLAGERVLTAGAGITITDNGPNSTIVVAASNPPSITTTITTNTVVSGTFFVPSVAEFEIATQTLPTTASFIPDTVAISGTYYFYHLVPDVGVGVSSPPKMILTATFQNPELVGIASSSIPTSGVPASNEEFLGTFVIGNKVYIIASGSAYVASASSPTVLSGAACNLPIKPQRSMAIVGDRIYNFGGFDPATSLATDKIYVALTSNPLSWSNTGLLLPAKRRHQVTLVHDGYVYIIGGRDDANVYQQTIFRNRTSNLNSSSWSNLGSIMPGPLAYAGVALVNRSAYILGGYSGVGATTTVWRASLDDLTTWQNSASNGILPGNRYGASIVVGNNGILYYYGGSLGVAPLSTNTIFRTKNPLTCSSESPFTWQAFDPILGKTLNGNTAVASPMQRVGMMPQNYDVTADASASIGTLSITVPALWRDAINSLVTTSSVSIDSQNRAPSQIGSDVYFFVSGNLGLSGTANGRIAAFGGDVKITGTLAIGTGSIYIDSNEIRWSSNTKLTKVGSDLILKDDANPSGLTLTQIRAGSSTGLVVSSGTFTQPDMSVWATHANTLPSTGGLAFGARFVVSGVMYLAGGTTNGGATPQRTVMYASMSNPFVWTSASNALPVVSDAVSLVIVGTTIYLYQSDKSILTSSVSNPLVWGTAAGTLPRVPAHHPTIIGSKIWMWGAGDGPGTIMTASISDPQSWSVITASMPVLNVASRAPFVMNGHIYFYGGYITGTNVPTQEILRATVGDPGFVTSSGASLPVPVMYPTMPIVVGDTGYLLGFQSATPFATSNKILKFKTSDPLTVFSSSFNNSLPEAGRWGNSFVVVGNPTYVLRIGGDVNATAPNSNKIHYTVFQNVCTYTESATSSYAPLAGKMNGSGAPTVQTPCERNGWPEWHADYAKQF